MFERQGPLAFTARLMKNAVHLLHIDYESHLLIHKYYKPPQAAQRHSGTMSGMSDPADIGIGEEACAVEKSGLLKVGKATGPHTSLTDHCSSIQSCLLTSFVSACAEPVRLHLAWHRVWPAALLQALLLRGEAGDLLFLLYAHRRYHTSSLDKYHVVLMAAQYIDALRLGDIARFEHIERVDGAWWSVDMDRGAGAALHFAVDHGQVLP